MIEQVVEYRIPLVKHKTGKYPYEGIAVQFRKELDANSHNVYCVYLVHYRTVFQSRKEWQPLVEYGRLLCKITEEHDKWDEIAQDVIWLSNSAISGTYAPKAVERLIYKALGTPVHTDWFCKWFVDRISTEYVPS